MRKTNKEDFSQRDSWQISVHKNSEALIELNSMLQPSAPNRPWQLHAERKDGDEWSSLIRIVLVGYKDKENSVNVYANVRPEDVKYLYSRVWNGVKEFSYSQQKIFSENEKATDGIVTVLRIQRHEKIAVARC